MQYYFCFLKVKYYHWNAEFSERLKAMSHTITVLSAKRDYYGNSDGGFVRYEILIDDFIRIKNLGDEFANRDVEFLVFTADNEGGESIYKKYKDYDLKPNAIEYNVDKAFESSFVEGTKLAITDNVVEIINKIYYDNNLLYDIDPFKFEEIIARLLLEKGFEINLTQKTRDNGYDIRALKNIDGFPVKFLVECKKYHKAIGINCIRSFCDVINYEQANKGILVTTSYFSKPSQNRQLELGTKLDLVNRDGIISWINDFKK